MTRKENKERLSRVELILQGRFEIKPRLLVMGTGGLLRILDYPYKREEFKFRYTDSIKLIIPSSKTKIILRHGSLLKIFDIETQKMIEKNAFSAIPRLLDFIYNPKTEHILAYDENREIKKTYLTVYDLDGEKVLSKEYDVPGHFYSFRDNLILIALESFTLIDPFTYELIRRVQLPSNRGERGFFPFTWRSENKILVRTPINTLVYDVSTEKESGVIKDLISQVVSPNYGIIYTFEHINFEVAYLTKLNVPCDKIKLPDSNYFKGEGWYPDEILLINEKRIFTFNVETRKETDVFISNRGISRADYLPGKKLDRMILFQILKRKLECYLPVDLIRLTFEQILS